MRELSAKEMAAVSGGETETITVIGFPSGGVGGGMGLSFYGYGTANDGEFEQEMDSIGEGDTILAHETEEMRHISELQDDPELEVFTIDNVHDAQGPLTVYVARDGSGFWTPSGYPGYYTFWGAPAIG